MLFRSVIIFLLALYLGYIVAEKIKERKEKKKMEMTLCSSCCCKNCKSVCNNCIRCKQEFFVHYKMTCSDYKQEAQNGK